MASLMDTIKKLFGGSRDGLFIPETTWPPKAVQPRWNEIARYRRRYENDRAVMLQHTPGVNIDPARAETYVPVPLPRKMARFSSSVLFAAKPTFTSENKQDEMDRLMEVNDMPSFCLKSGEKVASEGVVGIRVIRDTAVNADNVPLLTLIHDDQVIWDIRHGDFVIGGVAIVETRPDPDKPEVYRLLENHTAGHVSRVLYKGASGSLGKAVDLSAVPDYDGLAPEEDTGINIPTLIRWENVPGGASDLFGIEPLLDTLNEAESAFLDKARKSVPQVFVDPMLVDEAGRIELSGYHIMRDASRVTNKLGGDPKSMIETVHPGFDAASHLQYLEHLEKLIIMMAGYALASFNGLGPAQAMSRVVSGYALKLAQIETLLTRSGKDHMAQEALGQAIAVALCLMTGEGDASALIPTIELGDGLPSDPLEIAQQVAQLHNSGAASIETLVSIVHEDWDQQKIDEETARIKEEQSAAKPIGVTHANPFINPAQAGAEANAQGEPATPNPPPGTGNRPGMSPSDTGG